MRVLVLGAGNTGLSGANVAADLSAIDSANELEQYVSLISSSSLNSILQGVECVDGTPYSAIMANTDKTNIINIVTGLIVNINIAVHNNNMIALTTAVSDFYGYTNLLEKSIASKKRQQSWSDCTQRNFSIVLELVNHIREVGGQALSIWLNENFNITKQNTTNTYRSDLLDELRASYVRPMVLVKQEKMQFSFKNINNQVKAFLYSDYMASVKSINSIDKAMLFNSYKVTLEPNNRGKNSDNNTNNDSSDTKAKSIQKASFRVIPVLLLVGAVYGLTKSDKKTKK